MSVFSGDFLGFQLGDIHSQGLNITRVSSGNRYTDNLIPTFKDVTAEVPGNDGMYYWDTFFSSRTFQIDFAYDNLNDEDLRNLAKLFSFKGVKPLIFDETPHKKYMVKATAPPNLKYISFTSGDSKIYKGEGTVNLIAYYPFGIATAGQSKAYDSSLQGAAASNSGDLEADFKVIYDIHTLVPTSSSSSGEDYVLANPSAGVFLRLQDVKNIGAINPISSSFSSDYYMMIDTKTHLIEGLDSRYEKTGNLYNRFLVEGDFFNLATGSNVITSTKGSNVNQPFVALTYNELFY